MKVTNHSQRILFVLLHPVSNVLFMCTVAMVLFTAISQYRILLCVML